MRRLNIKLTLPIGDGGGAVEIPIESMDDFHPDQLYDNVEIFSGLSGLRQRLKTTSTFAKAAAGSAELARYCRGGGGAAHLDRSRAAASCR